MSARSSGALDYIRVTGEEPHVQRGREILAAHPELRALAGPDRISALWILALVTAQMALAVVLSDTAWYVWLPAAFLVGATIDHALWVLIHECAHNLVFTNRLLNRLLAMTANIPIVVPAAMSFCKYHLLHHRHMGELAFDADLSGPGEAGLVGRSSLLKTVWLAAMALVLGVVRPSRIVKVPVFDRWSVTNLATQVVAMGLTVWMFGWQPLVYLTVCTVLAVGLHPLGARWIQEHFVFHETQETYSYYGPLNRVAFNAGYHNEHHDLVTVPWRHLPTIRRVAHEYYDDLFAHYSWTRLLVAFITRRDTTLYSRIVRE